MPYSTGRLPGGLRVTTPPAAEPFTLDFVKNYLKVDASYDDDLIEHLIRSARSRAEGLLNMGLLPQAIEEQFERFPPYHPNNPQRAVVLKKGPIIGINSISYTDADEAQQTMAASGYDYRASTSSLPILSPLGEGWPDTDSRANAVMVNYQVGFADADSIPPDILDAMLYMIADRYDNRTDNPRALPQASERLLRLHRLEAFRS